MVNLPPFPSLFGALLACVLGTIIAIGELGLTDPKTYSIILFGLLLFIMITVGWALREDKPKK